MIDYEWFEHTGFCPKFNQTRILNIKYAKIDFNEYKKLEDDCENKFDCEHVDKYDCCPLYYSAPEKPSLK